MINTDSESTRTHVTLRWLTYPASAGPQTAKKNPRGRSRDEPVHELFTVLKPRKMDQIRAAGQEKEHEPV